MSTATSSATTTDVSGPLATLLSAAVLAPSGDNLQPWQFVVDDAQSTVRVLVDEARDASPMNAGQRMSRIACGAAVENIAETARHNHWDVEVDGRLHGRQVALIRLDGIRGAAAGQIPAVLSQRHTNRRFYDASRIDRSIAARWEEACGDELGVQALWITDPDGLRAGAAAIGRADAEMFGRRGYFKAFLSNVRFDLALQAAADEGLCVGSLELSAFERMMMPGLRYVPDGLICSWPMRQSFRSRAAKLVMSSSGLCVIAVKDRAAAASLAVGRLMQRAWNFLADAGFQVQPMMSIPVLANAAANGNDRGADDRFREWVGPAAGGNPLWPAAILRFGRAAAATARTGRRPLNQAIRSGATDDLAGAD